MHDPQFRKEVSPRLTSFLAYLGQVVLLADMVFFIAALIDAQFNYADMLDSDCPLSIPLMKLQTIVTIGYAFRCLLSAGLLYYKATNLFDFLARTKPFPRLGALCAPFMSMLLLTVIVYDYHHCDEISSLIPLSFAIDVIAMYVLLLVALIVVWGGVYLYEYITKKQRSKCVRNTLRVTAWGCVGFGGTIGILATVEQIRLNKLMLFLLFDTYSFVAVFFGSFFKCLRKMTELVRQNNPQV
jgi:hypothetical protein